MRVSINLVGILQEYYGTAPDTADGSAVRDIPTGTTVRELIVLLGIPDEEEFFIMMDGERIGRAAIQSRELREDDALVLIPVLKGG